MKVKFLAAVLAIVMAIPSTALAAKPSKPKVNCSGVFGFISCAVVGNFSASCLLPWGECNRRVSKRVCELQRDAAANAWREQQARGMQGPPPPGALRSC